MPRVADGPGIDAALPPVRVPWQTQNETAGCCHTPQSSPDSALSALNISTITSTVMLYWWDDKGGGGGGGMRYECLRNAREP